MNLEPFACYRIEPEIALPARRLRAAQNDVKAGSARQQLGVGFQRIDDATRPGLDRSRCRVANVVEIDADVLSSPEKTKPIPFARTRSVAAHVSANDDQVAWLVADARCPLTLYGTFDRRFVPCLEAPQYPARQDLQFSGWRHYDIPCIVPLDRVMLLNA